MPIGTAHDTDLYTIFRGIAYISDYTSGEDPSWTDLGNCVEMQAEINVERMEHKTPRNRRLLKDKEIVVETGYSVKYTLDEFSQDILAKFFMGTQSGATIRALTELGKEYSLKFESDNQAGPNERYIFHRCQISPDGPLTLVTSGNDWAQMNFLATGLDDTDNNPSSPLFDVKMITTSTTTSTTTSSTTSTTSSTTTTTTA